jgi:hypothetical protein
MTTHGARRDYIVLFMSLFKIRAIKNLHKAYLGKHLGTCLGYSISKGYVRGYLGTI